MGIAVISLSFYSQWPVPDATVLVSGIVLFAMPLLWRDIDRWLVVKEGIHHSEQVRILHQITAVAKESKDSDSKLWADVNALKSEISILKSRQSEESTYRPF